MVKDSPDKTDAPALPRKRRMSSRFEVGAIDSHYFENDIKIYYRQQYFEVIDSIVGDLSRRFKQDNFKVVRD